MTALLNEIGSIFGPPAYESLQQICLVMRAKLLKNAALFWWQELKLLNFLAQVYWPRHVKFP